jgi:hypothetical protein
MDTSVIAFTLMAIVVTCFALATLAREFNIQMPLPRQRGDTSLRPSSVDFLTAAAFIGAVFICFVLI